MIRFVLDASVGAKWILPDEVDYLGEEALWLLQGYMKGQIDLVVPELFWAEMGNIIWKCARKGRLAGRSAITLISWLEDLKLPTLSHAGLAKTAVQIAIENNQTMYDSIYVAMAQDLESTLITADQRLVSGLLTRYPVKWLGTVG